MIKDIKKPVVKSLNSFKEIGKDFKSGLNKRADKALDSPYDFANYLTLGAVDGIWSGAKGRADKMLDSPSDFFNYATFGFTGMVQGAVNPKDPLSKEHWLDSFGVATSVLGVKGASSTKPTGISSGKSTSSSSSNSSKGTGKYTGGRTQKELDDLAGDPSHGGKIRDQGLKEREIGLDLEQQGKLGKIIRDPQGNGGAEFIDTTNNTKWDVKSFVSYPNGHTSPKKGAFTVSNGMKGINKELEKNYNVIVDVRDMVPEHVEQLKEAIEKAGVSNRIIWYP
ncbi:hypothetical protein [Lysinibacillus boronitolerans]|uniref:Uncharacterized protein n=1 Tax=Lysinibacillus boronitolerans JCM 21713 = 10a = NBRC 103108 TaxID=1294264 RepID=A0ABR4Y525_9BACI|nr:hypothetical protein [Lysinibacillus boronitolerans]KGR89400.1 hypothetical protein CD31_00680 [Lysinibacillus boronitolerans JCM 21713 = 10a = NBRC 103108]